MSPEKDARGGWEDSVESLLLWWTAARNLRVKLSGVGQSEFCDSLFGGQLLQGYSFYVDPPHGDHFSAGQYCHFSFYMDPSIGQDSPAFETSSKLRVKNHFQIQIKWMGNSKVGYRKECPS